jgi:hypothetical protein
MGKEGPKSTILTSEKLHIENKTLFVDLKENESRLERPLWAVRP